MDRELNGYILVELIKTMKEKKCKVIDLIDVLANQNEHKSFEYNGEKYCYRTVYFDCIRENYNILKEIENSVNGKERGSY